MKNQHIADRINNRGNDSQEAADNLLIAFIVMSVIAGIAGFVWSLPCFS